MIGPADLSISLGVPGEFQHPKMVEAMEAIRDSCIRHKVAPGTQTRTPGLASFWKERGMIFLGCNNESGMLLDAPRKSRKHTDLMKFRLYSSLSCSLLARVCFALRSASGRCADGARSYQRRFSSRKSVFHCLGRSGRTRHSVARPRYRGRIHRIAIPPRGTRSPGQRQIFPDCGFRAY